MDCPLACRSKLTSCSDRGRCMPKLSETIVACSWNTPLVRLRHPRWPCSQGGAKETLSRMRVLLVLPILLGGLPRRDYRRHPTTRRFWPSSLEAILLAKSALTLYIALCKGCLCFCRLAKPSTTAHMREVARHAYYAENACVRMVPNPKSRLINRGEFPSLAPLPPKKSPRQNAQNLLYEIPKGPHCFADAVASSSNVFHQIQVFRKGRDHLHLQKKLLRRHCSRVVQEIDPIHQDGEERHEGHRVDCQRAS